MLWFEIQGIVTNFFDLVLNIGYILYLLSLQLLLNFNPSMDK